MPDKNSPLSPTPNTKIEDIEVYAMPNKFLMHKLATGVVDTTHKKKPNKGGNAGKILLITAILLLVIGGGIGGAIWYLRTQSQPAPINDTNQTNNQVDSDTTNQQATSTDSTNDEISNNQNEDPSLGDLDNTINEEEDLPPPIINQSEDSDGDGLNGEEEFVYSTNANERDSDRDGYSDGMEIGNLYNPLASNELLIDSGLVSPYNNSLYNYTILRPRSWLASAATEDTGEINFLPNSEAGEFITILVSPNLNDLTLAQLSPEFFAGLQPENFSLANQPALRTDDKVLMVTPDFIYAISYEGGSNSIKTFPTTFNMMLKSFKFLQ